MAKKKIKDLGDSERIKTLDIARRLGVGRTTVSRVGRWLEDQYPGYEVAIKGIEREMDERAIQREVSAEPFSYAALKRRYKLHFLLFPDPKPKKEYR